MPRRLLCKSALVLPLLLLPACGAEEGEEPQSEAVEEPDLCATDLESATPTTIQGVVDRLNELPKPTSIPCFIRSLPRPLELSATDSIFSAQPAVGVRSPRFFIFSGSLIITVVPTGDGAPLLEMGEVVNETDSVKAEIKFPVEGPLSDAAPYEGLLFNEDISTCGICHSGEGEAEGYPAGAFVSEAIRARNVDLVELEALASEAAVCDAEADPEPGRCAMLQALFGGEVTEGKFPETFDDFF